MTGNTVVGTMPAGTMNGTPQVLLAHHLKQLKLPTVLREYDKVARECARNGVDHPRTQTPSAPANAPAPRGGLSPLMKCTASDATMMIGSAMAVSTVRCRVNHPTTAQLQASKTVRPPVTVRTTMISLILSCATASGSSESMTKSASLPTVIEPLLPSSNDA